MVWNCCLPCSVLAEPGNLPHIRHAREYIGDGGGDSGLFSIVMPNRGGAAIQNAEVSVQVDNNFGLASD